MFALLGNPALGQIFRRMSRQRRWQLYLLLGLLLLGALAELFAIAAVIPFLTLLSGPNALGPAQILLEQMGAVSPREQLLAAAAIFAFAAVLAGALRIALAWMTQSFGFGLGYDLGLAIQTRLLYQPYAYHSARNSSDLVAAHEKVFALIHGVVLPVLYAFTAAVTSLSIVGILIAIDPLAAGIAIASVAAIYAAVALLTRRRLHLYGSMINSAHSERVRAVQESLGGIRDVLIDHSQSMHLAQFARIGGRVRRAEVRSSFIASTPRYAVEAAGMVLIALLAVVLSGRTGSFATAMPVLGAIALSGQRLLPLLQQVYQGMAQMRTGSSTASDLAALLKLEVPSSATQICVAPLPFEKAIRLERVSFSYPNRGECALGQTDLTIARGAKVALVGRTGSGKSTLADLLMGLLDPTDGQVTVDGIRLDASNRVRWQAQIAHVPQSIFLADASIARNIAFGSSEQEIDLDRVRWAAKIALADEFVSRLPEGFQTLVGERGTRLSGGQRQRIGIARALYKRAPVLIFDEATSALDRETEDEVIDGIIGLGDAITLVMIAHRPSSIAHCDTVFRLGRGRLQSDPETTVAIAHFG